MIKEQCISITDLRTRTKECISETEKAPKYVFINNKPVAVLMDIDEYEEHFAKPELKELPENQVDEALLEEAKRARRSSKKDLVDI